MARLTARIGRPIRPRGAVRSTAMISGRKPAIAVERRITADPPAAPSSIDSSISAISAEVLSELVTGQVTATPGDIPDRRRYPPAWMLTVFVDVSALSAPIAWNLSYLRGLTVFGVLVVALLAATGMYRPRIHLSALDDLPRLLGLLLIAVAIIASVIALRHDRMAVDGFLRASALIIGLTVAGRFLTTAAIRLIRSRKWVSHRAVLVGAGPVGTELTRLLDRYPAYGLRVVGFVDSATSVSDLSRSLPRHGDLDDVAGVLERNNAHTVIIADPSVADTQLADIMRGVLTRTHDVLVVPRLHYFQTQTGRPDHVGAIPLMRISPPLLSGWQRSLKRSIDVVVSATAIVVLAPVFALCAVLIRIEGGPGVFFRQERVGRNGKVFEILKFRSLKPVDEQESQTNWSVAHDSRVGRVGRALRRTSLDEIPQLWNILRGDMTLVGPRPERPFFVEQFSSEHSQYEWRHRVPAGLTGLAQVSGLRGDTPIADRARFDNYYIENWSLWLDFKIILRTLREVVAGGGR
jgi:exopolysaccharide biosynthesis polyprenyl glycosylphosphotransferase